MRVWWLTLAWVLSAATALGQAAQLRQEARLGIQALKVKLSPPGTEQDDALDQLAYSLQTTQPWAQSTRGHSLGIERLHSLKDDDATLRAQTGHFLQLRDQATAYTLGANALYIKGNDPSNGPLEEAGTDRQNPSFLGLALTFDRNQQTSTRSRIVANLNLNHNEQDSFWLRTATFTLGHSYTLTRIWTTTTGLRVGGQRSSLDQQVTLSELFHQHQWQLSQQWTMDLGLGLSRLQDKSDSQADLFASGNLQYASRSFLETEKSKSRETQHQEAERLGSRLRLGFLRSREQRRIGDPFFLSDQAYVDGTLSLSKEQVILVELRESKAYASGSSERTRDRSSLQAIAYQWASGELIRSRQHRFELRLSQEKVRFLTELETQTLSPGVNQRQLASLGYTFLF